jgi:hypothetical protein
MQNEGNNSNNNGTEELALTAEGEAAPEAKLEITVPKLSNTKRFDCGNGRVAIVRCASEPTRAKIEAIAGGATGPRQSLYNVWCAQWGITSLQGDWGKAPDGKPWKKVSTDLGLVQPEELVATIAGRIIGDIALYVNYGAYVDEVQGKD